MEYGWRNGVTRFAMGCYKLQGVLMGPAKQGGVTFRRIHPSRHLAEPPMATSSLTDPPLATPAAGRPPVVRQPVTPPLSERPLAKSVLAESGQAIVEFALVLPILLLLLMGIVDFGRVLSNGYVVAHAARDAARYASLGMDDSSIAQVVQEDTSSVHGAVNWTINPTPSRTSGQPVQVTVSAPVQLFDPLLATILGQVYTSSSTVTMRVE